ncbi:hypothetical protein H5119_15255 [Pseudoalteromonas sp. SG45-5]|uniref:ABC transporter permease/M1 family aminopeptidase n=1 Tax=unclassified Pseudoalteromonas TaxID=194690 RepID=UPI0015FB35F8|nr:MULTISPECIES: M1 family aminopeptidase [unclassified Pseudoalteromonas]MBB1386878.1 hypothetical protein [Pseudoalteromonas sp. SG45-5]MBB1394984.1 hypothetical protein [Pseudoalteromonas sp. SG44-4]MBB1448183.1 hypothetical protein [Pseudoalteromonas sp. SG41-6]
MLFKMMQFELRYFMRQPSFYITSLILFFLTFMASVSDSVQIGGSSNVNINSPYAILQVIAIMSVFAIFLVVNFVGSSAIRDDVSKLNELVLSKPLNIVQYKAGRFIGAYLVTLLVFSSTMLGVWVGSGFGSLMGWLDSEMIGENQLSYYLVPFFYIAAPSLFVVSSLINAVAMRFRSMVTLYLVAVALLISYLVGSNIFSDIQYREISAYLDMFGMSAMRMQMEYWTIAERNVMEITLTDQLLHNRLIWVGVALLALAIAALNTSHHLAQKQKVKGKASKNNNTNFAAALRFNITAKATGNNAWSQFLTRTFFEVKQVIKSYSFGILLILSLATLIPALVGSMGPYGTDVWPVTFRMVELIQGSFGILMMIVLVYYCGELVWHDRESRMADIIDAYPVANWVFWGSKYVALSAVLLLLCAFGSVVTLFYQMMMGMANFDIAQYVIRLGYLFVLGLIFQGGFAFLLQVISPNKYVGMGLYVLYFIATLVMSNYGFEHNMFVIGGTPEAPYSDINGYGHFLTAVHWYNLYWLGFSMIIAALSYALWPRGAGQNLKARVQLLGYQLGNSGKAVIVCGTLIFGGVGSFIYYNTTVLNQFITSEQYEDLQEQYEREFGQFVDAALPIPTDVVVTADIYPKERRITATVVMQIENKSQQPITRILVNKPDNTHKWSVEVDGAQLGELNEQYRHAWLDFTKPMQPNESREITMSVERYTEGFEDRGSDERLVYNGTFIDNTALFPSFGYSFGKQIQDKNERRQRGLPELKRGNKIEETQYHNQPLFADNYVSFAATITTDESQIAMVPGYLQSQSTKNGRTTFVYEMDAPMLHFYTLLSMELEVKKEQHNGVNIEVYHHKDHAWNVDAMIQSTKDSLDYFSKEFGPYQHKQMRIIEFPRYRSFAQSFANTVPFSENMGFITDTRDSDNINFPYYVTSHELAHQWWAHQVIGANVEGSNILSEMLSQYSAIMVMKEKYGENNLRKFLKYELDRYLFGRTTESYDERTLARTVGQQYIHYNKGSVVMMAIHDLLGEQRLNTVLRAFLQDYQYAQERYPTTLDFIAYLKREASEQEQIFIEDQFNAITLYELKLSDINVQEAESVDGEHIITLTISAAKKHADGEGNEEDVPLAQMIDIALFSADPNEIHSENTVIYMQKHEIKTGENTITLKVTELPKFAGVDPFIKLIDKKSGDNIKAL